MSPFSLFGILTATAYLPASIAAADGGLETELLVTGEFRLVSLLTFLECGHVRITSLACGRDL